MVSDFVTEHDGLLQLTDEEYREAVTTQPSIRKCAQEVIKFEANCEGYWNNERFLNQVTIAAAISKIKFHSDSHSLVWIFDQSSGHRAFKDDSLNINRMNVNPGGVQARMRVTIWDEKLQRMFLPDSRPKGMKIVLQEREVDTSKMKAMDMRNILGSHVDFKYEKTAVKYHLQEEELRALFLPKFHCKLNPIEN